MTDTQWENAPLGEVWELTDYADTVRLYVRSTGGWRSVARRRNIFPADHFTQGTRVWAPPKTPIALPQEAGTVIAIGDWWLVRLRSYEGAPAAWEFLPSASKAASDRLKSQGVHEQCVYGDEWVRAEIEHGFTVISQPPAKTVKRVLAKVEKRVSGSPFGSLGALGDLREVAAEFGVEL